MKLKISAVLLALLFACALPADTKVFELAAEARTKFDNFMEANKGGMTVTTERGKYFYKGKKLRVDINGDMGFMKSAGSIKGKPAGMDIKAVMIFSEDSTWIISSIAGKQNLPVKKGVPAMRYMFERFWWTLDLGGAKLDGEEKILDRECYRIIFEQADKLMPVKKVWVDKKNLMLVQDEMDMGPVAIRTVLSDFRMVKNGFEYPMTSETEAGERTVRTVVFGIDVKNAVDDSVFDPDKVEIKVDEKHMELMKQLMMKAMEGKVTDKNKNPMFDSTGEDETGTPEKPVPPVYPPPVLPPPVPENDDGNEEMK